MTTGTIKKFAKIKDHIRTIGTKMLGKYKDHQLAVYNGHGSTAWNCHTLKAKNVFAKDVFVFRQQLCMIKLTQFHGRLLL